MDALEGWSDFNVAMVGATAALAGLLIVAASVNIAEIVKAVSLTARLAAAIATLVLAIAGSAIGLIPGLGAAAYGVTILVAVAGALVFQVQAAVRIAQNRHPENRWRIAKASVGFVPLAAYVAGAVLVVAGDGTGLVLFAVGSILAIVSALIISWIVLVEVLR